ncbi:MAG: 30S ribosomal protein S20 [Spirochaetales bacterium]|nr:30S ribosomal protein S20 [Spirochaetales bacterium]
MATKQSSAEKRMKQDEKRRLRNKKAKSSIRTAARKVVEAVHAKDSDAAANALRDTLKQLDTAAGKGILKKNTAARKKSRLQKFFNSLGAQA